MWTLQTVLLSLEKMAFPITFDGSLNNLHQLLATRTLVWQYLNCSVSSSGFDPVGNDYVFFNGKSLTTF